MNMSLSVLALTIPPMMLLLLGLVPNRLANRYHLATGWLTILLSGLACLLSLIVASARLSGTLPSFYASLATSPWSPHLELSIFYDNLTAFMLSLVSFLGLITCRFSRRYLDGERAQGQYFKWMAFTIGAICWMVISGNLLMFLFAWFTTSLGLHQLLTHYKHRPHARRSAWTKFAISRLGDLLLFAAIMLTIQVLGSQALPDIIERSKSLLLSPELMTREHSVIVWLLVMGAAIKTVQFPFHAWLPDTLETPTPVSALMHAGIVNAGGYLLIRINPVLGLEPTALSALALVGAVTACLGVVIMSTQTSVKRSLAFSTVAQMGFMMLQCGLGAFSAAMLHILAHSMYKAYAFLNSGTVDLQSQRQLKPRNLKTSAGYRWAVLPVAVICSVVLVVGLSVLLRLDLLNKPGGVLLAFILILALSGWSWQILIGGSLKSKIVGLSSVAGICLASLGSYALMDLFVGDLVAEPPIGLNQSWVIWSIALIFGALFVMHIGLASGWRHAWLDSLRIHASSGFYFGSIYQRLFSNVLTS